MRHIDIQTCDWLSATWRAFVADGYSTAHVEDGIAVMWKGNAARDAVRNTDYLNRWALMRRQEQQGVG